VSFAIIARRQQLEMTARPRDVELPRLAKSIIVGMSVPTFDESGGYHLERSVHQAQPLGLVEIVHRRSSSRLVGAVAAGWSCLEKARERNFPLPSLIQPARAQR
jgi:hypothetical protein